MKQWLRLELPAHWTKFSAGAKVSMKSFEYSLYFKKHEIEWSEMPLDPDSGNFAYLVLVDDEEDVTALKLKMI